MYNLLTELLLKGSMNYFKGFTCLILYTVLLATLSYHDPFFEDMVYLNFTRSIIEDFDFNIINQVNIPYDWHVTTTFYHPTQHSEIITSLSTLGLFIEKMITAVVPMKTLSIYTLSGIFLNVLCYYLIFRLLISIMNMFEIKVRESWIVLLTVGSTLFYYTFFFTYISDLYVMVLTTFIFKEFMLFYKGREDEIDLLSLGITSSLCLVSKITFLPLFIISHFIIVRAFRRGDKRVTKLCSLSLLSSLIICIFAYFQNVLQYGEFLLIGRYLKYFLTDNFNVAIHTLLYGYFLPGGIFFNNPPFFLGLIGLILFGYRNISRADILKSSVLIFHILWSVFVLVQTIFAPMEYLNEQYVGRIAFVAFAQYAFGLFYLLNQFKKQGWIKVGIFVVVCFQIMNSFVYRALRRISHYPLRGEEEFDYILARLDELFYALDQTFYDILRNDLFLILTFILVVMFFLILIRKLKFKVIVIYVFITYVFLHGLSLKFSKENVVKYKNRINASNKVISSNPYMIYYSYFIDGFRYCEEKTRFTYMKELIHEKRVGLYKRIKGDLYQSTDLFDQVLEQNDFNFGYYCEPFVGSNCEKLLK